MKETLEKSKEKVKEWQQEVRKQLGQLRRTIDLHVQYMCHSPPYTHVAGQIESTKTI